MFFFSDCNHRHYRLQLWAAYTFQCRLGSAKHYGHRRLEHTGQILRALYTVDENYLDLDWTLRSIGCGLDTTCTVDTVKENDPCVEGTEQ